MSADPTIIVAGPPRSGSEKPGEAPPSRLEIHDLVKNEKQFSLYVQAVAELQKLSQEEYLSWFALGGIHGRPYGVPWDDVPKSNVTGYCVHGRVLFPTWHRPYVTLFEQALQAQAVKIAKQYQVDQGVWQAEAEKLRAPFWDWASVPTSEPPKETYDPELKKLTIIGFDGKPKSIDNPLLAFTFNPPLPNFPSQGRSHNVTHRVPGVAQRMKFEQSGRDPMHDRVYKSLTLIKNWYDFSNHTRRRNAPPPVANSLETVHDTIHMVVGGQATKPGGTAGDMSIVAVAGFDPFFWLHHANVDRLLAFWQTINPTVWVNSTDDPLVGPDTDLTPFWDNPKPSPSFHKSSSNPVRFWTDFNFTYPEFVDIHDSSPQVRREKILERVKQLYGSDATRGGPDADDITEWYARIWTNAYALGGSFTVYVFVGTPPESPEEWNEDNNLVGRHFVFANASPEECANCSSQLDDIHEGIVVLTTAVEEKYGVGKSEKEIEAYLKENLAYRVQKVDGTVVPTNEVKGFRTAVETIKLSYSQEDGIFQKPEGTEPVDHGISEGSASGA